jgi:hypothetical protein
VYVLRQNCRAATLHYSYTISAKPQSPHNFSIFNPDPSIWSHFNSQYRCRPYHFCSGPPPSVAPTRGMLSVLFVLIHPRPLISLLRRLLRARFPVKNVSKIKDPRGCAGQNQFSAVSIFNRYTINSSVSNRCESGPSLNLFKRSPS